MRTFLILLIAAGLGGLFYYQKHTGEQPAAAQAEAARPPAKVAQTNAAPREPSEHNWMKRSLDRATEVRDQARTQTQKSQDP